MKHADYKREALKDPWTRIVYALLWLPFAIENWKIRREIKANERDSAQELSNFLYAIEDDTALVFCGNCNQLMQLVRPGKWQCPECE